MRIRKKAGPVQPQAEVIVVPRYDPNVRRFTAPGFDAAATVAMRPSITDAPTEVMPNVDWALVRRYCAQHRPPQ